MDLSAKQSYAVFLGTHVWSAYYVLSPSQMRGVLCVWLSVLVTGILGTGFASTSKAEIQDINLVDLISTYPELSAFTRHLQRTRLIPTLNRIQTYDANSTGVTIFAPTNAAFDNAKIGHESFWMDELPSHSDNVQAPLRQQLLYHILNHTVSLTESNATYLETLYFPSRKRLAEPTHPGNIPQKPFTPSHPGAEDKGGLLGGSGQMLRVERSTNGSILHVGSDANGSHGANVIHVDQSSPYGDLYVIDRVLDLPPSLDVFLREQKACALFQHMPSDILHSLALTAHLTIFLPSDRAWNRLHSLEQAYLLGPSPQAQDDRLRVFGWHASSTGIHDGHVAYASSLRSAPHAQFTTILGGDIHVSRAENNSLFVNGMPIIQEDLLTENGVVHILDGMLLPHGDLGMTPEQYLLALNATKFVSLIRQAGLESYISQDPHKVPPDSKSGPFTFLVPSNEALERWDAQFNNLSKKKALKFGTLLREMLLYHILPGHQRALHNSSLPVTELRPSGLSGAAQRMRVHILDNGTVLFGENSVSRKSIFLNSTTLYLLDDMVEMPKDPVQTASEASLSTYVEALYKVQMDKNVRQAPYMTYIVPSDFAFESAGLVSKYLLSSANTKLSHVLSSQVLNGAWYGAVLRDKWTQISTQDGSFLWMRRDAVSSDTVVRTNSSDLDIHVTRPDLLTDTGVMHVVDRLTIPASAPISLYQLAQSAPTAKMVSLLHRAGFDWVWNETHKLEAGGTCGRQKLVLLVPEDRAFAKLKLHAYEHNMEQLRALMSLHVLVVDDCVAQQPGTEDVPMPVVDEITHVSLLDKSMGGTSPYGTVAFRRVSPTNENRLGYMVGIKGARSTRGKEHSAHVLEYGRASCMQVHAGRVTPGGILTIDTVLEPFESGWFFRWDWARKVCLLGALSLGAISAGIYTWHWRCGYTRVQTEALEGEEE